MKEKIRYDDFYICLILMFSYKILVPTLETNPIHKRIYLNWITELIINMKDANSWSEFWNGQMQYICNQDMIIARRLGSQYQQYINTIHKIVLEEILLLKIRTNHNK